MMKGILAIALLLAPVATFAATYQYVDTSGTVRTTTANSAIEALNTAPGIAAHSGVSIDSGDIDSGDSVMGSTSGAAVLGASTEVTFGQYLYADRNGVVQAVTANSAAEAFSRAVNIAPTSGVAIDTGELDDGDSVVNP